MAPNFTCLQFGKKKVSGMRIQLEHARYKLSTLTTALHLSKLSRYTQVRLPASSAKSLWLPWQYFAATSCLCHVGYIEATSLSAQIFEWSLHWLHTFQGDWPVTMTAVVTSSLTANPLPYGWDVNIPTCCSHIPPTSGDWQARLTASVRSLWLIHEFPLP